MRIWEWPGNFPYLNLIEIAWNFIKNNAQEKQSASITDLNDRDAHRLMGPYEPFFRLINCHNTC